MSYTKTINLELSERATVNLEVEFDIRPGKSFGRWDTDPGWGPELESINFQLNEVRFSDGVRVGYPWLLERGYVSAVENMVDVRKIEDALGDLSDYE